MNPLIKKGDILLLEKTRNIKLFGTYVFYNRKIKRLIAHRLVKIYKNKILFQGDNSASFFKGKAGFEVVPKRDVKGKIIGVIRKGKKIDGMKFKVLSCLSLVYALIKVLPYLIKRYFNIFLIKRKK